MKRLLLAVLALPLLLAGCSHKPYYVAPPPPPGVSVGQIGYNDGYNAARSDVSYNRPPSFKAHPRYRNPPVPPPAFGEYRRGFRDGYQRFLQTGGR